MDGWRTNMWLSFCRTTMMLASVLLFSGNVAQADPLVIDGVPVGTSASDASTNSDLLSASSRRLQGYVEDVIQPDEVRKANALQQQRRELRNGANDKQTLLPGKANRDDESPFKKFFSGAGILTTGSMIRNSPAATDNQQPAPTINPSAEREPGPRKSIMIRITHCTAFDVGEMAWEALRTAIYMQSQGADVTLVLDMDGVNVANRNINYEFQAQRSSTGKFRSIPSLFNEFLAKGGQAVANERWTKQYGLSYQQIPVAVKIIPEEQLNDLILQRLGSLMNY